jgi:hypothetical protein
MFKNGEKTMRHKPPERRYAAKSIDDKPVSQSTLSRKGSGNSGFLGRFLYWIAKGADKSKRGGTFCPS